MKHPISQRPRRALFLLATICVATPALAQTKGGNRSNRNPHQMAQPQATLAGQMFERILRIQLQSAGYSDEKLQALVVAYAKNKESARQPLYNAANVLAQMLSNPETTPKAMDAAVATFNAALGEERDRTQKAEAELNAQIKYSSDARLQAVLVLAGIIGDAGSYLSSPMANGSMPEENMSGAPGGEAAGGSEGQMNAPVGPPPGGPWMMA